MAKKQGSRHNPNGIPFSRYDNILKYLPIFKKEKQEDLSRLEKCAEGLLDAIKFNNLQREEI